MATLGGETISLLHTLLYFKLFFALSSMGESIHFQSHHAHQHEQGEAGTFPIRPNEAEEFLYVAQNASPSLPIRCGRV